MVSRLKRHPLVATFFGLSGNSRICILTEPLYGIPYGMIMPFVTLYMYNIGLNDVMIGTVISVGLFFQVISALIGGSLTDKYGRRKTTLIIDLLSWSVPCIVWMLAKDFWWFIAAVALNALNLVANVSWNCLLIEDSEIDKLGGIYTLIHIVTMASVFFAPIGGLLVERLGVINAARILYFIFFAFMTFKAILLYTFSHETNTGKVRMTECAARPLASLLSESVGVSVLILKTPRMLITLVVMVTLNITVTIGTNFYSLLLTQSLNMPPQLLAYFPIVRTVCILVFMFVFQNILERTGSKIPMLTGIIIYILSQFFLIIAGYGGMPAIIGYVVSEAVAFAIVMPRRDTLVAANIIPEERARISGIMNAVMLCVSIPFGYLAGLLSGVNRILPFIMNIVIYVFLFMLVLLSKEFIKSDKI